MKDKTEIDPEDPIEIDFIRRTFGYTKSDVIAAVEATNSNLRWKIISWLQRNRHEPRINVNKEF